jgi:prepilin-type N-terminal cleavage/methylation domain-containing protein
VRRAGLTSEASHRGFTLAELAVVIALIGVIAALAVGADSEDSELTRGYADQIAGTLDGTRARARATRRWHRVTVGATGVLVEEATTKGLAAPVAFQTVQTIGGPPRVRTHSIDTTTVVVATGSAPALGTNVPSSILFSPDGPAGAWTIYLSDTSGRTPMRVVVFSATGLARAYEGW